MTIIALTDLHGKTGIINGIESQLKSADLVFLCGDITHFGHRKEISEILEKLRNLNPNILAVSGNCDYPEVEQYLVEEGLSINAFVKNIGDYSFVGLCGSLPCPGKTPNEYSEEEYEAILESIKPPSDKPLIMVSHQPPFNTLNDFVPPKLHVGSKAARKFIELYQPLICFTGHIHEGVGIDRIGKTAVVNPGPAGLGGYVLAKTENNIVTELNILNQ